MGGKGEDKGSGKEGRIWIEERKKGGGHGEIRVNEGKRVGK